MNTSSPLEKTVAFHGRLPMSSGRPSQNQRHEIRSQLFRRRCRPTSVSGHSISSGNGDRRLTKLLHNVTIQRSLGPVQVMMSPENTVEDLIKAALEIYVTEKRRPLLTEAKPRCFDLHYSQFSLESLNPKEKLVNLGFRNFFLCQKSINSNSPSSSTCLDQAKKEAISPFLWTTFMDFLL